MIAARAHSQNAPLFQRSCDYDFTPGSWQLATGRQSLDYREPATAPRKLSGIELGLLGPHQAANAATAIAAIYRLRDRGWTVSDEAIRQGLAAARIPARIEQVQSSPTVILDVAHNLASIEALLTVLREQFTASRRVLIFASSKDKDYAGMLKLLLPAFDTIFLTQYLNNPLRCRSRRTFDNRSTNPRRHQHHSPHTPRHRPPHRRPPPLPRIAQPSDLICIAGSFFLAAELRPAL